MRHSTAFVLVLCMLGGAPLHAAELNPTNYPMATSGPVCDLLGYEDTDGQAFVEDWICVATTGEVTMTKETAAQTMLDLQGVGSTGRLQGWIANGNTDPSIYVTPGAAAMYMVSWQVISGNTTGTGATFQINAPTLDPTMFMIWPDVKNAFLVRTSSIADATNIQFTDVAGTAYTFAALENGEHVWGAGAQGAEDVGLERSSAGILKVTDASTGTGQMLTGAVQIDGTNASNIGLSFTEGSDDIAFRPSSSLLDIVNGAASAWRDVKMKSLYLDGYIFRGTVAGVTASTTQAQGQNAMLRPIYEISVVGNTNDVCTTLPDAAAGVRVVVINNGANTCQIFPKSGDDLGAGVNNATTLASGSNIEFIAYDGTNWEVI